MPRATKRPNPIFCNRSRLRERPATIGPDDVRKLLASFEELKTLIVERSAPDESNIAVIQETMNGIRSVIEEFKNHQRERSEADSSSLSRFREALVDNKVELARFRLELKDVGEKDGPGVVVALEPLIRDLRGTVARLSGRSKSCPAWPVP